MNAYLRTVFPLKYPLLFLFTLHGAFSSFLVSGFPILAGVRLVSSSFLIYIETTGNRGADHTIEAIDATIKAPT